MEQLRDSKLDTICEDIGEGLAQITEGTDAVNEGKAAAAHRLHARGLQAYRHAGVRVTLVPGAEKVTVKREKEKEVNVAVGAGAVEQSTQGPEETLGVEDSGDESEA